MGKIDIMTTEAKLREAICRTGASLFNRGLTHGSTGNISASLPGGGWLMSPTGSSLGTLDPAQPYPGADAEGQRGRAGTPKQPTLPYGWLDSRELNDTHRAEVAEAELHHSGG